MDLMRRGIITEDEALELLDKSNPLAEEGQSENKLTTQIQKDLLTMMLTLWTLSKESWIKSFQKEK